MKAKNEFHLGSLKPHFYPAILKASSLALNRVDVALFFIHSGLLPKH